MALSAIGLGSNAGDRAGNVRAAIARLRELGSISAVSRLYQTKPWGEEDQADFVNAVALLQTELSPLALLQKLKAIETELGRIQTYRWGPREIDLDILYYDDVRLEEEKLRLPHPHLYERAFVLIPLAEVDARFKERAAACDASGVRPL